jgi:hypothetical protein
MRRSDALSMPAVAARIRPVSAFWAGTASAIVASPTSAATPISFAST